MSLTASIADVTLIIAFSFVYGACPLVMTWIPNVIAFPAEKRAVAIAFVNSLGNSASIYGVFLWPSQDAPRYIPGFTATTVWVSPRSNCYRLFLTSHRCSHSAA